MGTVGTAGLGWWALGGYSGSPVPDATTSRAHEGVGWGRAADCWHTLFPHVAPHPTLSLGEECPREAGLCWGAGCRLAPRRRPCGFLPQGGKGTLLSSHEPWGLGLRPPEPVVLGPPVLPPSRSHPESPAPPICPAPSLHTSFVPQLPQRPGFGRKAAEAFCLHSHLWACLTSRRPEEGQRAEPMCAPSPALAKAPSKRGRAEAGWEDRACQASLGVIGLS